MGKDIGGQLEGWWIGKRGERSTGYEFTEQDVNPPQAANLPKYLLSFRRGRLKLPLKTMISDFENACLHQKFDFRNGQKQFGCAGSLCVEVK